MKVQEADDRFKQAFSNWPDDMLGAVISCEACKLIGFMPNKIWHSQPFVACPQCGVAVEALREDVPVGAFRLAYEDVGGSVDDMKFVELFDSCDFEW